MVSGAKAQSSDIMNDNPNTILTGKVVDAESGEALAGVEIKVVGTDIECFTDFEGNFELNGIVPGRYELIVHYISYGSNLLKNIKIAPGTNSLNDIGLIAK